MREAGEAAKLEVAEEELKQVCRAQVERALGTAI